MKVLVIMIAAAAVLTAGFFAFNNFIYQEKQGEGHSGGETVVPPPARVALVGTYVCLPHADPTLGTKECAVGMRTDTGVHYVLDLGLMSQTPPELRVGDRFSAQGVLTPIEYLSTDHWQKYDVRGIFSVTDSLHVI